MGKIRKKCTDEQITQILKEAEASNNVSDRWKTKYGGIDSKSIQRLRELERENARLKRIVADQMLDISMLRDINSKDRRR